MRKEKVLFSETTDDDFENGLLDALAQERSAIQEIEQEKEENSFAAETVSAPTSKKKLWRDTQKEALTRLEDSARTVDNSAMYSHGGTGWKQMQTDAIVTTLLGVPTFLWNGVQPQRKSFSPNRFSPCSGNR